MLLLQNIEELVGDALALLKVDLGRALRGVSGGRACPHAFVLVLALVSTYVLSWFLHIKVLFGYDSKIPKKIAPESWSRSALNHRTDF